MELLGDIEWLGDKLGELELDGLADSEGLNEGEFELLGDAEGLLELLGEREDEAELISHKLLTSAALKALPLNRNTSSREPVKKFPLAPDELKHPTLT